MSFNACVFIYATRKYGRFAGGPIHRARILRQLEQEPGQHLIVVRYGPDHRGAQEYVYNRADIDNAKVVWARDMGDSKNRRLLEYFKERQVWLFEPDGNPNPSLTHYSINPSP